MHSDVKLLARNETTPSQRFRNRLLKKAADKVREKFPKSTVEIDFMHARGVRVIKLDRNIVGTQGKSADALEWSGACADFDDAI